MRIDIDFIPGSHGNYLEFVLNKLLLGDAIQAHPFNALGASHKKNSDYYTKKIFFADHYYLEQGTENDKVITIKINKQDHLQLSSIWILRAGNNGVVDKHLHINTFNKLNNKVGKNILDSLLVHFDEIQGYDDIKASDWPEVNNVQDFYKLPNWIIEECKSKFNFVPRLINENSPDIQKSKLREFFKLWFKNFITNGLDLEKKKMLYSANQQVFVFEYNDFYDLDKFKIQIEKIREFFNLTFLNIDLDTLHKEFLLRQPYKNLKADTDALFDEVLNGGTDSKLDLTLFQESYIDARVELLYNIEMPAKHEQYFLTTKDIYQFIQNEIQK